MVYSLYKSNKVNIVDKFHKINASKGMKQMLLKQKETLVRILIKKK